jgi:hypothetical protein
MQVEMATISASHNRAASGVTECREREACHEFRFAASHETMARQHFTDVRTARSSAEETNHARQPKRLKAPRTAAGLTALRLKRCAFSAAFQTVFFFY